MKLKSTIFFLPLLLSCMIVTPIALAQSNNQQKKEEKESESDSDFRRLSVKLFEIKYRDPSALHGSLMALRSGAKGSMIIPNIALHTLTVRDFPENIAAIEEALKRLDVPDRAPISLEVQLHLIAASLAPSEKPTVPKFLEPVLGQLKTALIFTNYRYVSSTLNRVSDRGKVESSGVTGSLFPTPPGIMNTPDNPSLYKYSIGRIALTQDASGRESIQVDSFRFGVKVPIRIGQNNTQYQDVGITTPLSLRESELVVVGTANVSGADEAIIVVISVKKAK
jgi:hypothetical protein